MKRDEDGYLSAVLISKSENRVGVQFGFELVNYIGDDLSKRTGKGDGFLTVFEVEGCLTGTLHAFSFVDDCREAKLLPCSEIASPDNGFQRDDRLLVRLDMRVKQRDNELCKVAVDGKTATCQVSFLYVAMLCLTPELKSSGSQDS